MKIYTDKRLLACGLVGGTISRHSGNMREPANQTAVFKQLEIPTEKILHFHQVHSDTLVVISDAKAAQAYVNGPLADADGWVLAPFPAGWGAAIVTADCVPVFLWSTDGQMAALAHCGWRGVVKGLPGQAACTILKQNPGAKLQAWLGPHIQDCCFEVQADVASQFPTACVAEKQGKLFVHLTRAITRQLAEAGLAQAEIVAPYDCTCGDKENFFSWRRDHQKNLLLSFVYKP